MKIIQSPVDKFPGTVTLKDPVLYPDYIAWEEAVAVSEQASTQGEKEQAIWSGIRNMVDQWDIKNIDLENPCSTPRNPVLDLLAWLVTEIGKVINGTDPN